MPSTMTEPITITESGEERIRLIIDTTEAIRQAIDLRVAKERRRRRCHVSKSEIATEILGAALSAELAEVESWDNEPSPKKPRK